jgi:hypothetical protein
MGVNIDVTDRKNMEDELRKSEERYRLATKANSDAIWDIDLKTGSVTWPGPDLSARSTLCARREYEDHAYCTVQVPMACQPVLFPPVPYYGHVGLAGAAKTTPPLGQQLYLGLLTGRYQANRLIVLNLACYISFSDARHMSQKARFLALI